MLENNEIARKGKDSNRRKCNKILKLPEKEQIQKDCQRISKRMSKRYKQIKNDRGQRHRQQQRQESEKERWSE